uniref:Membralin n=1 Tax=Caenorhabditis tropicalis TaxID=1561998 RepID=A0A1I7T5Z5_9PELO
MSGSPENPVIREPPPELLAQIQNPTNSRIENPPPPPDAPVPPIPRVVPPQHNHPPGQNNSLNAARDRLFHAMLVRVALKYSGKVSLKWRRFVEGFILFWAFLLLASLLFIHINFTRCSASCLDEMEADWVKKGIVRIEVVRNLKVLERKEQFIAHYISNKSNRICHFNPADVFRFGPNVIPYSMKDRLADIRKSNGQADAQPKTYYSTVLSFLRPQMLFDHEDTELLTPKRFEMIEDLGYNDPLEFEAHNAFYESMKNHPEPMEYEYLYQVEYAMLYGVLRLPPDFRDAHGIPMAWIRIDSKSACFGDQLTRLMMRLFVGYEDTIIAALRAQAINLSLVHPETNSMGYLHNLQTNDHYHFVANSMGKASYLTAGLLMIIFTFAISMLLRFSHHQIFVFIIDLLHMFELQQPLNPPVAPLITVVLALVGMEAIMAEVFNDTSIAFYVILIVWVADQYDAICCHSTTSKKFWLRFFYIYQFFFYSYQYRFAGQYGGLALLTSAMFIIHSMIYFFHHYEMPLILYQDRVSQVLADLHAPQNGMGTVEVQTITVAVHNRNQPTNSSTIGTGNGTQASENERPSVAEPLSPSSVFDARGPNLVVEPAPPPEPASELEQRVPQNPEEIIAHQIVNDAMNELFNQE